MLHWATNNPSPKREQKTQKSKTDLFLLGATSIGGRERGNSSKAEVAAVRQQEYRALGEEQTASGFRFDDNDDFDMLILVQAGMC